MIKLQRIKDNARDEFGKIYKKEFIVEALNSFIKRRIRDKDLKIIDLRKDSKGVKK